MHASRQQVITHLQLLPELQAAIHRRSYNEVRGRDLRVSQMGYLVCNTFVSPALALQEYPPGAARSFPFRIPSANAFFAAAHQHMRDCVSVHVALFVHLCRWQLLQVLLFKLEHLRDISAAGKSSSCAYAPAWAGACMQELAPPQLPCAS
jgi:hypothetical protein